VYSLLGITAYIRAIGDVEEQEQSAREEKEIQEALARFAEVDALELWGGENRATNDTATSSSKATGFDNTNDMGVVISRNTAEQPRLADSTTNVHTQKRLDKPSYKSKIRSSPLILSEEEPTRSTEHTSTTPGTPLSKKRKLKLDHGDQKQTSVTSIDRKRKKRPKNEIDALFAGLG